MFQIAIISDIGHYDTSPEDVDFLPNLPTMQDQESSQGQEESLWSIVIHSVKGL